MKSLYLSPADGRKSFYGKAQYIEMDGEKLLKSYETIVCKVDKAGRFRRLWGGYSATTQRHVNAFRNYVGLPAISKKEWELLEV